VKEAYAAIVKLGAFIGTEKLSNNENSLSGFGQKQFMKVIPIKN
jgi:hypothetical protein